MKELEVYLTAIYAAAKNIQSAIYVLRATLGNPTPKQKELLDRIEQTVNKTINYVVSIEQKLGLIEPDERIRIKR